MTTQLKHLLLGALVGASLLVGGTAEAHDRHHGHHYRHYYYGHQSRVRFYTAPYYPYGYSPYYAGPSYGYSYGYPYYYGSGLTFQFGGGRGGHYRHWR